LGVPTIAWRIYLSMLLLPLNGFYDIDENQHGFQPGKGTLTAWRDLLPNLLKTRNVLEVDFEACFPSITAKMSQIALSRANKTGLIMPPEFTKYFFALNCSKPVYNKSPEWKMQLPEHFFTAHTILKIVGDKIKTLSKIRGNEEIFLIKDGTSLIPEDQIVNGIPNPELIDQDWIGHKTLELKDPDLLFKDKVELNSQDHHSKVRLRKFFEAQGLKPGSKEYQDVMAGVSRTFWNDTNQAYRGPILDGLPQGAGTSPYMSILYLQYFLRLILTKYPTISYVIYADDIIFFSKIDAPSATADKEFKEFVLLFPKLCAKFKLKFAMHKSAASKTKGIWQTEVIDWNKPPIENTNSPTLLFGLSSTPTQKVKFLGISYYPVENMIKADTRKGSHLAHQLLGLIGITDSLEAINKTHRDKTSDGISLPKSLTFDLMLCLFLNKLFSSGRLIYFLQVGFNFTNGNTFKRLMRVTRRMARSAVFFVGPSYKVQADAIICAASSLWAIYSSILAKINTAEAPLEKAFTGPYAGIIQSRLYLGSLTIPSFDTPSGSQSFKYKFENGSLAHILSSKLSSLLTVFNGSSIATYELVHISSALAGHRNKPRKLLAGWKPFFKSLEERTNE
jgi:hypothetical protein